MTTSNRANGLQTGSATQKTQASHATTVIPLDPKDQWKPIHNIRLLTFFVIRQQLDVALLRTSLDTLIRKHLPILGARIKATGQHGSLEYHQPNDFAAKYKLFEWSDATSNASMNTVLEPEDAVDTAETIRFCPAIPSVERHWYPPTWPVERKFEKPDSPLLFVHVTQYPDAAVLAVNLPHAVSDMNGFASFMRAWLTVARGNAPESFLELKPGQLNGPPDLPDAELRKPGTYRLCTKKERVQIVAPFIPELIFSKEDRSTVFFPASLVESLRTRLAAGLKAKHGGEMPLSNGDVVSGLCLKLGNLHRKKSSRMLTISESVGLRGRHQALPSGKPYLHNALAFLGTRIQFDSTTPLADIVYHHRQFLIEGIQPLNLERNLAVTTASFRAGRSMHYCEPGDLSFSVTSWSSVWRDLDFLPVVLNAPDSEMMSICPPSLVFGHCMERGIPTRFNSVVMCKGEGGYWCDFTCSRKNTPMLKALLKQDPLLESL